MVVVEWPYGGLVASAHAGASFVGDGPCGIRRTMTVDTVTTWQEGHQQRSPTRLDYPSH